MSKEEHELKPSSAQDSSGDETIARAPHAALDEHPEEGRLLTSRAFWFGGLLSVVLWIVVAALLDLF